MKTFRFVNAGLAIACLVILVGCGSAGSNAPTPASATLVSSKSNPTSTRIPPSQQASPSKTLKIVSSMPLTGVALTDTQTVVNAHELRLIQAHNRACGGRYTPVYEAWDDATALPCAGKAAVFRPQDNAIL